MRQEGPGAGRLLAIGRLGAGAGGWVGLGWVGLGWVGLGWVGLGWVGLGWLVGWLFFRLVGCCFFGWLVEGLRRVQAFGTKACCPTFFSLCCGKGLPFKLKQPTQDYFLVFVFLAPTKTQNGIDFHCWLPFKLKPSKTIGENPKHLVPKGPLTNSVLRLAWPCMKVE